MCAICGFNWEDKNLIKSMSSVMTHRGPDASGFFVDKISLGHRRLSIIDLSSRGKQPMSNEEGDIWISYNGEIYNFKEIRDWLESLGHKFKSDTDTEVVIHAYEEEGENCLARFNGMFAFAIWDSKKKQFFLARDRIGVKPLYYHFKDNRFIFASELKAILKAIDTKKRRINKTALANFLSLEYVPAPETIFEDIKKLPAGNYLIFKNGKCAIEEYWDLRFNDSEKDFDFYVGNTNNLFKESVKRHLISDVPVGVFLSGGLDSSAIVDAIASDTENIKTFSIGFEDDGFNELKWAKLISELYETEHHELVCKPDMVKLLPKIVEQFDEPFADPSMLPTFLVSELAKKHVKVVLSGTGGDELFGGYEKYKLMNFVRYCKYIPGVSLVSNLIPTKAGTLGELRRLLQLAELPLEEAFIEILLNNRLPAKAELLALANASTKIREYMSHERDFFNKVFYTDIKTYLCDDLLVKDDKMTMLNSIECRVPFLDKELVEFAATVPFNLKINGVGKGSTKYLLRRALIKHSKLPGSIIKRKKRGFGVPIQGWFKKELFDYCNEMLLNEKRSFLDYGRIKQLIDKHKSGKEETHRTLWSLLCLELWCRRYLDEY